MNYYIQGNPERAKEIKAAFEKLGYNVNGFDMCNDNILFFTYKLQTGANVISTTNAHLYTANIIKTHPDYKELELPVEPKFKVGNEIKTGNTIETIAEVDYTIRSYYCESGRTIYFANQDLWHLVPKPHYDISSFKPFDKVLVRYYSEERWKCGLFSHLSTHSGAKFVCVAATYTQCIPFNDDTKHLLGTTDPCDEQYINW